MPMHSWYIGGSSTRRSATSLFANHRCPVSKISSSGRTPSSWIRFAPARSMSGVLNVDEAALAEVQAAAVQRADLREQLFDVREPLDAADQVGAVGEARRVVRVE